MKRDSAWYSRGYVAEGHEKEVLVLVFGAGFGTAPPSTDVRSPPAAPVARERDATASAADSRVAGEGRVKVAVPAAVLVVVAAVRVLVDADPVVVAVVALVPSVQVPGVHLVVVARAFGDAGLHEAALGVLALGARNNPAVPRPPDVAIGWHCEREDSKSGHPRPDLVF